MFCIRAAAPCRRTQHTHVADISISQDCFLISLKGANRQLVMVDITML